MKSTVWGSDVISVKHSFVLDVDWDVMSKCIICSVVILYVGYADDLLLQTNIEPIILMVITELDDFIVCYARFGQRGHFNRHRARFGH